MRLFGGAVLGGLLLAACSSDSYAPKIDPEMFVVGVRNPYFPLIAGTSFQYTVAETGDQTTVTVTSDTKVIMGVTCMVVHDQAMSGGTLVEDTFDYYAQDKDGTVWYFGEDTTEYEGGTSSTEGSWLGGVDGAQPGILMPGMLVVGDKYRQEYLEGEAEDRAEVLALNVTVTVPYAFFIGCVQTRDYSSLEPDVEENKYYCPSIGLVRSIATKGPAETEDLVALTRP